MKHKIILMALIAILTGAFSSCKKNETVGKFPILYVVNGTDYSVDIYCDNRLVTSAGAHNNSGDVKLSNTSINVPVYVEAEFYDNKGQRVRSYTWNNFYFQWDKTYKMTLTNSSSTSSLTTL